MLLNFLASLAEYERELTVEHDNAGITAARQSGTRFGRPPSDPAMSAGKLTIAKDARAKGRTAEGAARLVGWSRTPCVLRRPCCRRRTPFPSGKVPDLW